MYEMFMVGCTISRCKVALASKFCTAVHYLWVRLTNLPSCHLLGAKNFERAHRFLENLCISELGQRVSAEN